MSDTTNPRRETFRAHVQACFPKVPGARTYALDDPALDSLAVLASCWQLEREAHDVGFSRDDLTAFLTGLSRHLPQLVQQKPAAADAPAATPKVWTDEVTGQMARNPWSDPQDVRSQAAVEKHDPALAAHLQRIAKGGVTYAMIAELREASAKRERLAAIRYGEAEHRVNPFLDPAALTAQSELKTRNPELAEVCQREAQPLTLPWQIGHGNMTMMNKLSVADPLLGRLTRSAAELLQQWTKDELVLARQAEEQARRVRVEAEQRLAPPPKLP